MRYSFKLPHTVIIVACAAILACGCQSQRTFSSPENAASAFADAVKQQDKDELHRIFGPDTDELKSGDPEQDHDDMVILARRLATAYKIRMDSPEQATILIGPDAWPFAVPIVKKGFGWQFDTDAGIDELNNRRVGRNELVTIAALKTLIDAQAEFFNRDPDALGVKHYAQRLMSTEGKKDGLYWPAPGGVDPSPIGPELAFSATQRDDKGERIPFNGYFYKLLKRQVASAPGGAMEYMENGQFTKGWAVLAYPADYDESGVMSFICSSNGVIYQKDLGDDTDLAVTIDSIDAFDPGDGWTPVGQ